MRIGSQGPGRKRHSQCKALARVLLAAAALALTSGLPGGGAHAQGFLDFLFGRPPQPRQAEPQMLPPGTPPPVRPQANRFSAGPPGSGASVSQPGSGRSQSFCVRLCDGRYFPLERQPSATATKLCSAFCPASPTKIFLGSAIDHAVAPDGERYSALKNAYLYRKRIVPDCTCNGRDAFGLATLTVASDPTLRAGDVVEGMPRNEIQPARAPAASARPSAQ
jgi:hypothetical protein